MFLCWATVFLLLLALKEIDNLFSSLFFCSSLKHVCTPHSYSVARLRVKQSVLLFYLQISYITTKSSTLNYNKNILKMLHLRHFTKFTLTVVGWYKKSPKWKSAIEPCFWNYVYFSVLILLSLLLILHFNWFNHLSVSWNKTWSAHLRV